MPPTLPQRPRRVSQPIAPSLLSPPSVFCMHRGNRLRINPEAARLVGAKKNVPLLVSQLGDAAPEVYRLVLAVVANQLLRDV